MKKLVITIFTLTFCVSIIANEYKSIRLENISKSLGYETNDTSGVVISRSELVPDFSIKGVINDGTLEHLGLFLFKNIDSILLVDESNSSLLREDILLFCEREFLDLYLSKNNKNVKEKLTTDRVNIIYNGDDYRQGPFWKIKEGISSLKDYKSIHVKLDSTRYQIMFKGSQNTLSIEFPANMQVIQGMDKRELDDMFFTALCKDTIRSEEDLYPIKEGTELECYADNLMLLKGETFIIDAVNSDKLYYLSDTALAMVYDQEFTAESIRNLFYQDNERTRNIKFNIGQRLYDGNFKFLDLSLGAFVAAAAKEYDTYIGVEEGNDSLTIITVNLHNPDMNIFHVLETRTTTELLFESGVIVAKARTYIPTDNLQSLYLKDNVSIDKDKNKLPRYTKSIKY